MPSEMCSVVMNERGAVAVADIASLQGRLFYADCTTVRQFQCI